MAAAIEAREVGAGPIAIIERDCFLGGILNQCIHNGFGLHVFNEELTGPEYAQRYVDLIEASDIAVYLNTMVVSIEKDHTIRTVSDNEGALTLSAKAIVLAMGCRERPRSALGIPGTRPAGVMTAGTAQRLINIDGYHIGKNVFILGSGDIGLIMARRLTLEGARVVGVAEIMPFSSGLTRNVVQCLDDFSIPLALSHTVVKIEGDKRVTGVWVSQVDAYKKPILGTEYYVPCDTLLLSVGLIPENELSDVPLDFRTKAPIVNQRMETLERGIFACGNVLHVHDLVDFVTEESMLAGREAMLYAMNPKGNTDHVLEVIPGEGLVYAVPQCLSFPLQAEKVVFKFRVSRVYHHVMVKVTSEGESLYQKSFAHVFPGEMAHVSVDSQILSKAKGPLCVCLEKG